MTRSRALMLAFGVLVFCLASTTVHGQSGGIDLKPYRLEGKQLSGTDLTQLQDMKQGKERTRGPKEKANKELFQKAAGFFVYRVTQDQYYTGGDTGELKARTGGDQNLDVAFDDLALHLLVPTFTERTLIDQMNYIEDFGEVLDKAVVDVLTGRVTAKDGAMPPPVIRINAARMLALVSRTGASAHAKTITALLTNQFFKQGGKPIDTPPEVLYWAMVAAENLLAAPNPSKFGTPRAADHSIKDEELVPLVRALNDIVLKNPKGLAEKAAPLKPELAVKPPPPPGSPNTAGTPATPPGTPEPAKEPKAADPKAADPKALTAEQANLIQYFRRQAIRALGKLRFDTIAEGTPDELRPGYTLAKVAVSDASLSPAPSVSEVGEATIGLCGIHPSQNLNVDSLLHVIGYGVGRFFTLKSETPADKSLAWVSYSDRINDSLALLQKNAQINPRLRPFRQKIDTLAQMVTADVTTPITTANGTNKPSVERLFPWVQANQPKTGLYTDGQQYQLSPRAGGG